MARVRLQVSDEQRKRWEEYAEQEYEGILSQLVRRSVQREINDSHSPSGTDHTEELASLAENQERILTALESLQERVENLEADNRSDPVVVENKNKVFELLPDEEPGTRAWEEQRQTFGTLMQDDVGKRYPDQPSKEEIIRKSKAWEGTVEALADALEEPEYIIEKTLQSLQETTELIRTTERRGETHFYKVN